MFNKTVPLLIEECLVFHPRSLKTCPHYKGLNFSGLISLESDETMLILLARSFSVARWGTLFNCPCVLERSSFEKYYMVLPDQWFANSF